VTETEKEYLIKADLPGLNKQDVKITLHDDMLTLEGERKEEKVRDTDTRHLIERTQGKFIRSFRLPSDCRLDSCNASMENGVLQVSFQKRAPQESGRRRIDIR
jgi:HSP20 family protein